MCTVECSHFVFLCQYVKLFLNSIYSICDFGKWLEFSRISISEYEQWIGVCLATSNFRRLCFLRVGWHSRLQQFNLCLMFLSLTNYIWPEKYKVAPESDPKYSWLCIGRNARVLVVRTLTLPVSLHSFHCQHPLSSDTESVCVPASF